MIQIDDSGSGSLIGGTCIGLYNTETKQYYYEIIPIKYYNKNNFPRKKYLDYAIDIVKHGFQVLSVSKNDTIEVCRGYMFDKLRNWLNEKNYNWKSTQITGYLQDTIEKTFEEYAISLGFPKQYIKYTRYPFHFHRILRWVYADYHKRSKLCKVGWKSWEKYGKLPTQVTYETMPDKCYSCLKCGKTLEPFTQVKVLRYVSNKPNTIYLHVNC
ncbi:MAG: hypothetical protein PWR27_1619 [Petroclostridium sp.]|uniref:hypothetical protein n=1 Tax=Petroclostridium xylanilyticum TaxID=1792311 RepID=UPI000B985D0F|nr:hypothetical protein [Petroclostridium xylanilyticum]MBZ4645782.1 hypothetical protein [Clostridia bacterium]MDK2810910.1 hypothetical protein [Petroclostridium sp.]